MNKRTLLLFSILVSSIPAIGQNTFPVTGSTGIGTVTPATTLQVIGVTRMGGAVNYAQFAADGDLSLTGTADFIVGANRYVFRYSAASNFGLYFNQTDGRYEFKNAVGNNAFHVTVAGRGYFSSGLSIGTSTLPTGALLANGVIESSSGGFKFPDGTTQTTAVTNYWTSSGGNIYNNAGTNVGIGDNTPAQTLDVNGSIGFANDSSIYNGGVKFIWSNDVRHSIYIGKNSGANTGAYNIGLGEQTLSNNSLGTFNIAIGVNAMSAFNVGSNNIAIGREALGDNSSGASNIAIGDYSLGNNSSGSYNCAIGKYAMQNNTGTNNCALGYTALQNNAGSMNSAFGMGALYANDTATNNSAFGGNALYHNTTGYGNSATGAYALSSNTTGNANTAMGLNALTANTTGKENTAVGLNNMKANTTGEYNCSFGSESLLLNTTGSENTSMGVSALGMNTTGHHNTAVGFVTLWFNTVGEENCAFGSGSMVLNTRGDINAAYGNYSLHDCDTGYSNTAIGYGSLYQLKYGYDNAALGVDAGGIMTNSSACMFIGSYTYQPTNAIRTNSVALGYSTGITASNQVRIGNSGNTSIGGFVNWTNISDGRFKNNVKENVPGLEFINKLHPVTYTLDVNGLNEFLKVGITGETESVNSPLPSRKKLSPDMDMLNKAADEKSKIIYTGFIAQDVEKSANEIGYNFSGVDKPQNDETPYGLRYAEFVVPLVKSVQELSAENDSLKNQLSDLNERLEKLEQLTVTPSGNQLNENTVATHYVELNGSEAKLEQNIPNPFTQTTSIAYYIPSVAAAAEIKFYDERGMLLKTISITDKGIGKIELKVNDLAAGNYTYTLFVDGKMVDTKKMILIK